MMEGRIRDTLRLQREMVADRDAVQSDLEEVEEKCRHIHIIAESEKERMKVKKKDTNEKLELARYRAVMMSEVRV